MNSSEYWKKREEENLRKNQKTEQQIAKEIQNQYAYMADSIEKEINGFYTKYAKKEGITMAEARNRVSQLDIDAYSRKAKKYVKDKEFSAKANEEMRLYNATMKINRLELLKANIGLETVSGFNELDKTFGNALTKRAKEEHARQSGILGSTVQDMQKAAKNIANASFKNATYSERVWMYQEQMKSELNKLLQEGLIQGKNPKVLASHMRKLFGASKSDAERLLATEMARVQTDVQKDSFERNGYEQYEFIAIGSACGVCRGLDGKHFDVKKMLPGENAPPMHPNCRCSTSAYMDRAEFDRWLAGQDEGNTEKDWNMLKNGLNMESDIGKTISDIFTGISKQRMEFDKSIERIANQDIKRLLKKMSKEVAVRRSSGKRSKYSTKDKTVHLAGNATSDTLAHEFFHAIDDRYGLTKSGMFSYAAKSDYNKLQNISKGYGNSIEEMLYLKYKEAFNENEHEITLKSEYRGVSDIINGMSGGEINMGFWHTSSYWKQTGKIEAEMFAQLGRSMYCNNPKVLNMIKDIFPDSYNEFISSLERIAK